MEIESREVAAQGSQVEPVVIDGRLSQSPFVAQIREEPWRQARKRHRSVTTGSTATLKIWQHHPEELVNRAANLLAKALPRRLDVPTMVLSPEPLVDEIVNLGGELLECLRTASRGVRAETDDHRNSAVDIACSVPVLRQPGHVPALGALQATTRECNQPWWDEQSTAPAWWTTSLRLQALGHHPPPRGSIMWPESCAARPSRSRRHCPAHNGGGHRTTIMCPDT